MKQNEVLSYRFACSAQSGTIITGRKYELRTGRYLMKVTVKKIPDSWVALGLAAHFVAKHNTFARFPAGDLIRTLSTQINRGHYLFALDTSTAPARVVGYIGWALYDNAVAELFRRPASRRQTNWRTAATWSGS